MFNTDRLTPKSVHIPLYLVAKYEQTPVINTIKETIFFSLSMIKLSYYHVMFS